MRGSMQRANGGQYEVLVAEKIKKGKKKSSRTRPQRGKKKTGTVFLFSERKPLWGGSHRVKLREQAGKKSASQWRGVQLRCAKQ